MGTVRMGFPQWTLFKGFSFQTSYTDLTDANSHLPLCELRKETDCIFRYQPCVSGFPSVKGHVGGGIPPLGEGLGAGLPPSSTGGCNRVFMQRRQWAMLTGIFVGNWQRRPPQRNGKCNLETVVWGAVLHHKSILGHFTILLCCQNMSSFEFYFYKIVLDLWQ